MIDPREHLEIIKRLAAEITSALDRGEVPSMSDGKVLLRNAQYLSEEINRRFVESLRKQATRTDAEDRASQFATVGGERI